MSSLLPRETFKVEEVELEVLPESYLPPSKGLAMITTWKQHNHSVVQVVRAKDAPSQWECEREEENRTSTLEGVSPNMMTMWEIR